MNEIEGGCFGNWKVKRIFRQRAASIRGIVCACVCDQPIFKQHRATPHDFLRRSWTDSDVTNILLAKFYPILM